MMLTVTLLISNMNIQALAADESSDFTGTDESQIIEIQGDESSDEEDIAGEDQQGSENANGTSDVDEITEESEEEPKEEESSEEEKESPEEEEPNKENEESSDAEGESGKEDKESKEDSEKLEESGIENRTVTVTMDTWGGDLLLSDGGRVFISADQGTMYSSSENDKVLDEHTAAIDAEIISTAYLELFTGWIDAELVELTHFDGTVERIVPGISVGEEYKIELTDIIAINVVFDAGAFFTSIHVSGFPEKEEAAPVTPYKKNMVLMKSSAPTTGSTTITLTSDSYSTGRSYDSNTGYYLFCLDPHASIPSNGQAYNYEAYRSTYGSILVYEFILYNWYTKGGTYNPESGANAHDWNVNTTGAIWAYRGQNLTAKGYTSYGAQICANFVARAQAYANSNPNGKSPEKTVRSTIGVLTPQSGSTQVFISVGGPQEDEQYDPVGILLKKLDKETGEDVRRVLR